MAEETSYHKLSAKVTMQNNISCHGRGNKLPENECQSYHAKVNELSYQTMYNEVIMKKMHCKNKKKCRQWILKVQSGKKTQKNKKRQCKNKKSVDNRY